MVYTQREAVRVEGDSIIFKTMSLCAHKRTAIIIFQKPLGALRKDNPGSEKPEARRSRLPRQHPSTTTPPPPPPPPPQQSKRRKDGGEGAYRLRFRRPVSCAELPLFPPIYRSVGGSTFPAPSPGTPRCAQSL
ncbi:unnamed protein product [Boreogadus saida]